VHLGTLATAAIFSCIFATTPAARQNKVESELARLWRLSSDLAGKTVVTNTKTDYGSIIQLEYLSRSGVSYLKLLGHLKSIRGRWAYRVANGQREICFSYPPLALEFGAHLAFDREGCEPLDNYRARLGDVCDGDAMGLSRPTSDMQQLELPIGAWASCASIAFVNHWEHNVVLGELPPMQRNHGQKAQ
jgi:hypothetical protein